MTPPGALRLLLVGYGKMGRLIEALAPEHDCRVTGRIDLGTGDWSAAADAAIERGDLGTLLHALGIARKDWVAA